MGKVALALPEEVFAQTISTEVFAQPYDFLGKGAQFYAFSSRDGLYVLKLFKTHHGFFAGQKSKEERRARLFRSAGLAQDKLAKQTGLLQLHLHRTNGICPEVLIYDKLHIAHRLYLDEVAFVLQKKGETAESRLRRLFGRRRTSKSPRDDSGFGAVN